MSQTTSAAESRRKGCPSFDTVWANLPEELSPTSAFHGESFVFDEEENCFNVNDLCRNTFLHLDSSSPLARLSVQDLVRSFKEFSASISNAPDDSAVAQPGERQEASTVAAAEAATVIPPATSTNTTTTATTETSTTTGSPMIPAMFPRRGTVARQEEQSADRHHVGAAKWDPATPATVAPDSGSEWPLIEQGSIIDFVMSHSFKGSKEDEGDLLLLTPSPVAQSLLIKKEQSVVPEAANVAPIPPGTAASPGSPPTNSETPTIYREGHPLTCKPCAFFWSKGCLNGDKCQFCHLWHMPKRKKPMREQRNLMIIAKDDGKITFLRCSIKDVIN